MDSTHEVYSLDNPSDQLSVGYDDESVFLVALHHDGDRMVGLDVEEAYSLAVTLEWITDPIRRDRPALWPPRRAMAGVAPDNDSVNIVLANEDDIEVIAIRLTPDDANRIAIALFRAAVHAAWLG